MKTSKIAVAIVLSTFLYSASVTAADSKQKPPVAELKTSSSWYQSVINFFDFI